LSSCNGVSGRRGWFQSTLKLSAHQSFPAPLSCRVMAVPSFPFPPSSQQISHTRDRSPSRFAVLFPFRARENLFLPLLCVASGDYPLQPFFFFWAERLGLRGIVFLENFASLAATRFPLSASFPLPPPRSWKVPWPSLWIFFFGPRELPICV